MKLCSKSVAEPERGTNAPLINTSSLATRPSLDHNVAVSSIEEFTHWAFYQVPVLERMLTIVLGLTVMHTM